MEKNNTSKCKSVIGGQYQISVLRDNFVPMILGALGKVDTGKVWAKTGKTSTVYRGRAVHVVDCIKACFSHIYDETMPYIGMNATFFKSNSDDITKDCFIAEDEELLNDTKKSFNVLARISLYPLGKLEYLTHMDVVAELAEMNDISIEKGYYADDFKGDVQDMFDFVNDIIAYGNEHLEDYALSVTMTIYGPEAMQAQEADVE